MLKNQEDYYSSFMRTAKEEAAKKEQVFFLPLKLEELMKMEFPENTWLVQDLIPVAGITAISGQPRSFKTWILFDIAIAVSSGKPLFDEFITEKANVLIVDEESGLARIKRRLVKLNVDNDLPIFFWSLQEFKLEEVFVNKLIEYCQKYNVELVILDSLVRLHNQDENAAGQMAQVSKLLRRCTTQGITIVFAHHNKKPGYNANKNDLASAMRGSGDILAVVDCHIAVTRDYRRLILTQTKSRDSEELPPVELDVISSDNVLSIEYVGKLQQPESKISKAKPAITEVLSKQPNLSQKQLLDELRASGVDISIKTLRKVLQEMEADGTLSHLSGSRNSNLYQLNMDMGEQCDEPR